MILLRAIINAFVSALLLYAIPEGCNWIVKLTGQAQPRTPVWACCLGVAGAILGLALMSYIQRKLFKLSIMSLIFQNVLSTAVVLMMVLPVAS